MECQVIRLREVAERLGVCEKTLRRWWTTGSMPPPTRLGRRLLVWRVGEIERWLESQRQPERHETIEV